MRPNKVLRRVSVLLGSLWFLSGNLERIIGWISGALSKDAQDARSNLDQFLNSYPILEWIGDPIIQTSMGTTGAMVLAFGVTLWLWPKSTEESTDDEQVSSGTNSDLTDVKELVHVKDIREKLKSYSYRFSPVASMLRKPRIAPPGELEPKDELLVYLRSVFCEKVVADCEQLFERIGNGTGNQLPQGKVSTFLEGLANSVSVEFLSKNGRNASEKLGKLKIVFDERSHITEDPSGITILRFLLKNTGNHFANDVSVKLKSLIPVSGIKKASPYSSQFNSVQLRMPENMGHLNPGDVIEIKWLLSNKDEDWFYIEGINREGDEDVFKTPVTKYKVTLIATARLAEECEEVFILTKGPKGKVSFKNQVD